jgi:mono/diheme cytochrome c family protein
MTFATVSQPFGAMAQSQLDGAAIYATRCVVCHQPDGVGAIGLAPSLAGTLAKRVADVDGQAYVAQVLVAGLSGPIVSQGQKFNGVMPTWAALPDTELAAVLNHVLASFNDSPVRLGPEVFAAARQKPLSPAELRKLREKLISRLGE